MRIRRYAARLLSSSTTTTNPASAPPQPAAPWLQAAADDCCAFCDLIHSSKQESPDAVKRKGQIAGRVPESEVRSGERVDLAQGVPAPQAKKCKIDHGPPFSEADADAGLGLTNGGSVASETALKSEGTRGATLGTKADANLVFEVADGADIEQGVKCGGSLETDAVKPNDTGGNSLENESTTDLEVWKAAPLANEVASDPEVTGRFSLESRAATLPEVAYIEPDVTGESSVMNDSGAGLGAVNTASSVSEASSEPSHIEGVSRTSKNITNAGITISVPEDTRSGSLSNEGSVAPEVTDGVSLVQEAAELEAAEDPIASDAACELEDTGRASCSADDDPASYEAQPPSFDAIGNMRIGNAGETVAIAMQPSCCDVANDGGSASSTSNPVGTKDPTVEGEVVHDRPVTPSVSCMLDVAARSIGRSGRTDVICYARRKGKKKLDLLEVKTENIEFNHGIIGDQIEEDDNLESIGPSEHVTSRPGFTDVKLADIKRELMDDSTARMLKKMKRNKFECDIDYCRMAFKTKTELSVHKKNICTVKSCSRNFRSHRYLRRHQSVHNDDMPYKCPWEGCTMAFKGSWDRTEHFKVHTGAKPYKCTTPGCRNVYKFVSDFIRHTRRCKPQR